jgi:hypothetical protein
MKAGYSKKSLAGKLGVQPNTRIIALNMPAHYESLLGKLPDGTVVKSALTGSQRFIHFFSEHAADLENRFPSLKDHLSSNGTLWISWPKKTSGVRTDLTEDLVRAIGLRNGLVDVKVCAVDDVWSGLKFVYRLRDR